MGNQLTAATRLMTMIHGSWQTHAIAAFTELGVADLLAEGPRPVADLAKEAGADSAAFPRFIRACQSLDLVLEEPAGHIRLTEMGMLLRSVPASFHDFALVHATPAQLRPDELLAQAVRDGQPKATAALGEPIWEYYARRPGEARLLGAALDGIAAIEAPTVVSAVDLTDCQTIVELRGGVTATLAALLDAAPATRGILVDSPEQVAASRQRLGEHLRDRIETRADGPLMPPQDLRADLYLISHGLQMADDHSAGQALARVRAAGHARTRLVIVHHVLTGSSPPVGHLLDLHALVLLGGRERTADELTALLSGAGWRLERTVPANVLSEVLVAVPS
jgi:hypothetical protein